ncbi:hypothetical protein JZ751_018620, partial [Albula glossodonta]
PFADGNVDKLPQGILPERNSPGRGNSEVTFSFAPAFWGIPCVESRTMDAPVCLIENVDGKLTVCPDALTILQKIDQPVVVVGVVGLYRTGKSYLMNKLAGKQQGFALGATIQSKTKGIWMWALPHPARRGQTLVLLDTEGLGDVEKGDQKNDAWIFSLAILLSSTLVYNSRGTIDNQAVENLHNRYVTELTERIKVKSPASGASSSEDDEDEGADAMFVQFFPNFIWTVRDFTLELKINSRAEAVAKHYAELLGQNEDASEELCSKLLVDLSSPMADKLQQGFYAKPGGYELYCSDRDRVAEEVLEQFLQAKSIESNAILQADNKLTEQEKKIHEEQTRAALLEQQRQAEEEKRLEMERTLQEERRSQEEKLRMMAEKMEEAAKCQRAEAEKAMECKLQEQRDLLEKGFKDKADLMSQEIQLLKDKNSQSENSGNFFTKTILPVLSQGMELASNIFQYKAAKNLMFRK